MTNKQEKVAKATETAEATATAYDEEWVLPLTAEQLAELEKNRQEAVARDAARARAYRDQVRGLPAPVEIAGD